MAVSDIPYQGMTWPLVGYWGWIPSTPVIPKLYWDVYSDEQRTKDMCCHIQQLIDYTSVTDAALNDMHADILKIDGIADNALQVAQSAEEKVDSAVETSHNALEQAGQAVTIATRAEGKIDVAISKAGDTLEMAETALDMANKASDYAKQKADEFAPYTSVAEPLYITDDTLQVRVASAWNKGTVKPGNGLKVAHDGTLSVIGG